MVLLECTGNTPLIELKKIASDLHNVSIYAKAEYFNPSGSVKDRAAKNMCLTAIRDGKLTKDKVILDSTSGNTGIAYAMWGAILGFQVELCMPANASMERKKIINAYGAKIIETDPLESSDGAYRTAKEMAEKDPERYFFPDQYNNDANWMAHYHGTAVEILRQTDGKVTHFVSGTGTSGTFMGTSKRLKESNPNVHIVYMQPDSPFHGLEGMKHMESTLKPGFFDETIADATVVVSTEAAYNMTKRLAKVEGLFVGVSSGANVCAALETAKTSPEGSKVVTILCDNGYRYLSEPVWREGGN